jgi:hypothetical protein
MLVEQSKCASNSGYCKVFRNLGQAGAGIDVPQTANIWLVQSDPNLSAWADDTHTENNLMRSCCVKFFKTLLGSDGHPFKVLQQTISVGNPTSDEEALRIAQERFECLELVPNWRLHADTCQIVFESLTNTNG